MTVNDCKLDALIELFTEDPQTIQNHLTEVYFRAVNPGGFYDTIREVGAEAALETLEIIIRALMDIKNLDDRRYTIVEIPQQ